MLEKVKVSFVGCGGIANWHMGHLLQFEDVTYGGFYDVIPERAEKLCARAGAGKVYGSLCEMLDDSKPDAVFVCVPPAEHGAIEAEVVKRGIAMSVQKPMALSMDLAKEICAQIEEKGIIHSVCFQDRYIKAIEQLKEYLKGRKYGLVRGSWIGGVPMVPWWRTFATSGGQIVEQNIHLFDMLRYIVGEPETVYVASGKGLVQGIENYDVDDYSSATITFKNGVVANLLTGDYVHGYDAHNGLTFYCEDALVDYQLRQCTSITTNARTEAFVNPARDEYGYDRTFITAVKTGDQSILKTNYRDAMRSLAFTLACNKSAETGMPVKIDDMLA